MIEVDARGIKVCDLLAVRCGHCRQFEPDRKDPGGLGRCRVQAVRFAVHPSVARRCAAFAPAPAAGAR